MVYKGRPIRKYRKRKQYKKKKYRQAIARIPKAIPLKPKSVCQKLVYYNTFLCRPANSAQAQQNYFFKISLNSPWLFPHDWDAHATTNTRYLSPNANIVPCDVNGNPTSTTTRMPGLREGYSLFNQYENGCVLGSKVVIQAMPCENDQADLTQSGVLYAFKHAKLNMGLSDTSTINDIQKLPFRQIKRLAGPNSDVDPTSGFTNRNTGAKIIVKHSPKKFNNLQSLRDNQQMKFVQSVSSAPDGTSPVEQDFLTIGVVPSVVNYVDESGVAENRGVTNFKLSLRVEQTILFTEPLENLSSGTGNYSLPWNAKHGFASGFGAYMGATAYTMAKMYNRRRY